MDRYINTFKSLSDRTRIRILHLLLKTGRELCICEIVDSLNIAQYNVSRHMRDLKITGLVKERRERRFIFYSINQQPDKFFNYINKAVLSISENFFQEDNKRLKKRLSLRKNGKCVAGSNNRKIKK